LDFDNGMTEERRLDELHQWWLLADKREARAGKLEISSVHANVPLVGLETIWRLALGCGDDDVAGRAADVVLALFERWQSPSLLQETFSKLVHACNAEDWRQLARCAAMLGKSARAVGHAPMTCRGKGVACEIQVNDDAATTTMARTDSSLSSLALAHGGHDRVVARVRPGAPGSNAGGTNAAINARATVSLFELGACSWATTAVAFEKLPADISPAQPLQGLTGPPAAAASSAFISHEQYRTLFELITRAPRASPAPGMLWALVQQLPLDPAEESAVAAGWDPAAEPASFLLAYRAQTTQFLVEEGRPVAVMDYTVLLDSLLAWESLPLVVETLARLVGCVCVVVSLRARARAYAGVKVSGAAGGVDAAAFKTARRARGVVSVDCAGPLVVPVQRQVGAALRRVSGAPAPHRGAFCHALGGEI